MKKKSALRRKNHAQSLWVGRFDSLDELEAFIDGGSFEKEQGFVIEPPLLPFNAFEEDGGGTEKLLGVFLRDAKRLSKAKKALASLKLSATELNAAILHEHFVFDPKLAPRGKKRMTFVGTF